MYANLSDVLEDVVLFILQPLLNVLTSLGLDLTTISIKIGFGSVTWFDLTLDKLLKIFVSIMVWFVTYKMLWKVLKWLWPFKNKKRRS